MHWQFLTSSLQMFFPVYVFFLLLRRQTNILNLRYIVWKQISKTMFRYFDLKTSKKYWLSKAYLSAVCTWPWKTAAFIEILLLL